MAPAAAVSDAPLASHQLPLRRAAARVCGPQRRHRCRHARCRACANPKHHRPTRLRPARTDRHTETHAHAASAQRSKQVRVTPQHTMPSRGKRAAARPAYVVLLCANGSPPCCCCWQCLWAARPSHMPHTPAHEDAARARVCVCPHTWPCCCGCWVPRHPGWSLCPPLTQQNPKAKQPGQGDRESTNRLSVGRVWWPVARVSSLDAAPEHRAPAQAPAAVAFSLLPPSFHYPTQEAAGGGDAGATTQGLVTASGIA